MSRAEQSRVRNVHINFLRVLAIVTVVLCHAVEQVYRWDINFIKRGNSNGIYTAFTIGCLGVPIFMFITGYLLLDIDIDYDDVGIKKFLKKNLLLLLVTTEIWIVIYDVF